MVPRCRRLSRVVPTTQQAHLGDFLGHNCGTSSAFGGIFMGL